MDDRLIEELALAVLDGTPVDCLDQRTGELESDYRAPCLSGTRALHADTTFDVHIVLSTLLSSTGTPESVPRTGIWISGVVSESGSHGPQPIAGASVVLTNTWVDFGFPMATTLTDSGGRYVACTSPPGVGTGDRFRVDAFRIGYSPAVQWVRLSGANTEVDFALARR